VVVLAASAPFISSAWQFMRRGVPDVLFTGDGATLELRVLHAAHGTQLLGPYSRFEWSHPGPAFFYLALPLYEAFHRHGPALNLFVLLSNLTCAIALALTARRLRGDLFALAVTALLAAYEGAGADFQLSGEWNPVVPILPLGLLSLLCARLAQGMLGPLPFIAFLASAIVQTHVGFTPVVVVVVLLASALHVAARPSMPRARRLSLVIVSALVLALLWMPPVVENVAHDPGNLTLLERFFTAPHAPEHPWRTVIDTVAVQLTVAPLALVRVFAPSVHASGAVARGVGAGLAVGVSGAVVAGVTQRDRVLLALSSLALGEMGAACFAVRAVRGEVHPYLVEWISMVGWVGCAALLAWLVPWLRRTFHMRAALATGIAALALTAASVRAESLRAKSFREPDEGAERLAHEVERHVVSEPIDRPVVRIVSHDVWPTAAAVVLDLVKHDVPIFVEPSWLFMMGHELAASEPGHVTLLIGDREFCKLSEARPDLRLIATVPETCALVGDPGYLHEHRVAGAVTLVRATGVRGDPARAVDGIVPAEGTRWDSALSIVLVDKASSVEVAVPVSAGELNGVFLSADGSDTYAVDCVDDAGTRRVLGRVLAGVPVGMGTGFLFTNELASCAAIRVRPDKGDGFYSVGEVGFLRK